MQRWCSLQVGGGRAATRGAGRLLSWRPLQALGKVSYAWYLWHWPVLLLGATVLDVESPWNRLLLVALSLGIAALSYYFFETPIRHQRKLLARPRLVVTASLCIMVLCAAVARHWQHVAPGYATGAAFTRLASARDDSPLPDKLGCVALPAITYAKTCAFGDTHARHLAILMGDSIATAWFPAMHRALDRPDWRLLSITKDGCPMVDQPYFNASWRRYYTECSTWRRNALRKVAGLHPDLVVISSYTNYPFTYAQWTQGTAKVLRALSASAEHVYVIRSAPTLPFSAPECLEPRVRVYRDLTGAGHCVASAYTSAGNDIYAALRSAASPFQNVHVIDMTNTICPNGLCAAERAGAVIFRDSHHMTSTFAATLAPEFAKAVGLDQQIGANPSSERVATH